MGLFQKKIQSSEKSKDELNDYVDNLLENSDSMSNEEIDDKFSVESMSLNSSYGIDHVINLMRDLPADAGNVVISTVTKTLESANINVSKIVEDAQKKESSLTSQISDLNNEIDSLKELIARKKEQINVSSAILEETRKVRELLQNTKSELKPSGEQPAGGKKSAKVSAIKESSSEKSISENEVVEMALEAQ